MKSLEAQHLPGDPLDETMVLFKDVVEVFDLQNFNRFACAGNFQDCIYGLRSTQIRSAFINDNLVQNAIACDSFLKETACSYRASRQFS